VVETTLSKVDVRTNGVIGPDGMVIYTLAVSLTGRTRGSAVGNIAPLLEIAQNRQWDRHW